MVGAGSRAHVGALRVEPSHERPVYVPDDRDVVQVLRGSSGIQSGSSHIAVPRCSPSRLSGVRARHFSTLPGGRGLALGLCVQTVHHVESHDHAVDVQ